MKNENPSLREWIDEIDKLGKLVRIDSADWELEIGAISSLNVQRKNCSALLFDEIKDYPHGFRVVTCSGSSPDLLSLSLNLPRTSSHRQLVETVRRKLVEWESNLEKFD